MLRLGRTAIVLIVCWLVASTASAADRFALVIGNQAYNDKVGPLRNPHNDIAVVGKALKDVGFDLLAPRKDATRDQILFAVYELARRMRTAGRGAVSFLYYAGHGVSVGADNILIPTNVEDTSDAEISVRGVRIAEVLDILTRDAPEAVHFVVLDACRNIRGQRGDRGFVPVNEHRTGVVLAFATSPGKAATDDGATSAPYAAALADEIVKPGRTDQAVFNAVRARVVAATRGQTPWTHDGLIGERVVFKASPAPPASAPVAVAPPPSQPRLSEAAEAWDRAKDATNVGVLEAYAKRFNDTFYAELARARIEELKKLQVAIATPPPAAKPLPAPEVKPAVQFAPMLTLDPVNEAKFSLLQSTEIIGITRTFAGAQMDVNGCAKRCLAETWCQAFSFHRSRQFCYLIDQVTSRNTDASFVSASVVGATKKEVEMSGRNKQEGQISILENVEITGSTRTHVAGLDVDGCAKRCLAERGCQAFAFDRRYRFCYLIDGVTSTRSDNSFVSGRLR